MLTLNALEINAMRVPHTVNRVAVLLVGVLCLLVWPLSGTAHCATNEASQDLRELEQEGKLTVRALRGWNMLPEPFMQLALSLRRNGIDILGADLQEIQTLANKAQSEGHGVLADHAAALSALSRYMEEFAAKKASGLVSIPSVSSSGDERGPQSVGLVPAEPGLASMPVGSPVQDADLLGLDDYDWRDDPGLEAEKQAIGQQIAGFQQAMDNRDIPAATAVIAEDRRDIYAALFAGNAEAMPEFGALFHRAQISFLSPPADPATDVTVRTAEYALELDGFTFYVRWMKDGDTWFLADF